MPSGYAALPTDVWLGVSAYLVAQDVAALSHLDRRMKEHQLYKYRWMDTLERRLGIEDETFETVRNWYPGSRTSNDVERLVTCVDPVLRPRTHPSLPAL